MEPYTIYKSHDGTYHAKAPDGEDMRTGDHQFVTRRTAAEMADYLNYLGVPFLHKIEPVYGVRNNGKFVPCTEGED